MIRVAPTAILAAVLPVFALAAESWPQFRGPNSSGVAEGKPPAQFGPDSAVLRDSLPHGIPADTVARWIV
jgi:hypothetical protein